jgi:hypothetical protein
MLASVLLFLLAPLTFASALPAQAQSGERCFPQTSYCISGPIRAYWESNGGLPVFGYPITAQRNETVEGRTLPVQWFERDRLEIQANGSVTAGRLGARLLQLQGRPWETFEKGTPQSGCNWMEATGHNMCEPFWSYWQQNGGLERFGYPITEAFYESIEGNELLVQYYERRRMEWHTEMSGQPILLGLLGVEVLQRIATQPQPQPQPEPEPEPEPVSVPECFSDALDENALADDLLYEAYEQTSFNDTLGCPLFGVERGLPAASQNFENGEMHWFELPELYRVRSEIAFIHAIINPGPTFRRYNDTWREGEDPDTPDVTPPRDGLYAPWGGFGKVWMEDSQLRNQIGWAIEPQARERTATVVMMHDGNDWPDVPPSEVNYMVLMEDTRTVYVFGNANTPSQVEIIRP